MGNQNFSDLSAPPEISSQSFGVEEEKERGSSIDKRVVLERLKELDKKFKEAELDNNIEEDEEEGEVVDLKKRKRKIAPRRKKAPLPPPHRFRLPDAQHVERTPVKTRDPPKLRKPEYPPPLPPPPDQNETSEETIPKPPPLPTSGFEPVKRIIVIERTTPTVPDEPSTPSEYQEAEEKFGEIKDLVYEQDPTKQLSGEKNVEIIPFQVLMNVMYFCDLSEVLSLSNSCRVFNAFTSTNAFWQNYYQVFFKVSEPSRERLDFLNKIRVENLDEGVKQFQFRNDIYSQLRRRILTRTRGQFWIDGSDEEEEDSGSEGGSEWETSDDEDEEKKKKRVNWKKQFFRRYFARNDRFYRKRYIDALKKVSSDQEKKEGEKKKFDKDKVFNLSMLIVGDKDVGKRQLILSVIQKCMKYYGAPFKFQSEKSPDNYRCYFAYHTKHDTGECIRLNIRIFDGNYDNKEEIGELLKSSNCVLFCFSYNSKTSYNSLVEGLKPTGEWSSQKIRNKCAVVGIRQEVKDDEEEGSKKAKPMEVTRKDVETLLFMEGDDFGCVYKYVHVRNEENRGQVKALGLGVDLAIKNYRCSVPKSGRHRLGLKLADKVDMINI